MSPKKQAPSLNTLCIRLLSNLLIHALSDDECLYFDEIKKYMFSGTYEALQALLNDILGIIHLDASTRFSCLETLLREDVKYLEVGIFPRFYYEKILVIITGQGKRLQHLNLKGVWVRDYSERLSELIANLPNLKTLLMPHMADDMVINSISNLNYLIKLDISGEACYTTNGIRSLKSNTLRYLDIGSFGKPDLCHDSSMGFELVAEIIQNLPNLSVLKTYSFTGHALLHLLNQDDSFKSKLSYLHDTGTDLNIIRAIVKTCPWLESIHVNYPDQGVVAELVGIRKLHSLKLTQGDGNELTSFLHNCGFQLQRLQVNHNRHDALDLGEVCETSPEVSTLECYQMNLKFTNPNVFFMNLQRIQILYCDITDSVVKSVLTNSPFLKSITVGSAVNMTDGDMFR